MAPADPSAPNSAPNSAPANDSPRELAVLVHGIASTRWIMLPLAARLRRRGFDVRLLGYYSLTGSNRKLGAWLARNLRRIGSNGRRPRVHLVAHSMGSIVSRCALQEELPENFGRVVMLGPPNGGSHMATFLERIYWFSGPLMELKDTPDSFVNRLPPAPAGVDIGVLAAKHDNVIAPDRTHLAGQRDHHVVNSWHTGILWRPETADYTANFLRHGRFGGGSETQANNEPANTPIACDTV
ncbi:MAG: alpha/beta fold hydrolase [Planctomycetota bacterium]